MDKKVLIDTNLYLDDAEIIYKLSRDYDKILIPVTVLKELDKHKFNKDLAYSARNAIRSILKFLNEYPEKVLFDTDENRLKPNDEAILDIAIKHNATVMTKDVSMSIIGHSRGINTKLHDVVLNNLFKPYVHIHMDDLQAHSGEEVFAYNQIYEEESYEDVLTLFSKFAGKELDENSWFFVIIDINKTKPIVYANNPMTHICERIDNNKKYREVDVEGVVIKARDCYQICAFYALSNAPHTLITGRWGTGKSILTLSHTLANTKKKIFITRPPIGINNKYDIGLLPGPKEDKMFDWLQGFMSALYYLYANTRSSSEKDGSSYDYVKDEIFKRKFEIMVLNSIQGLSLLDNDVMIIDEVQLLDVSYMSMLLSRPSEGGKLILLGDIKQTYGTIKPSESGLLKLLRVLPHKYLAYVELQNSYRSPLLEVADKLQDSTIF